MTGYFIEIERDRAAEAKALAELTALGFGSVHEVVPVYYQHAHTDDFALREYGPNPTWLQIVTQEVPRLRRAGWTVHVDNDFPVQVLSADADIEAELVEGSGIDWLELHLGVTVDGEQVDLVPALVRLIARPEAAELVERADDKPFVLTLLDGRLLSLPMSRIRPTLQALLELWTTGGIDEDYRENRVQPPGCRRTRWPGGTHRLDLARRRGLARPRSDAAPIGRNSQGRGACGVPSDAAALPKPGGRLAAVPGIGGVGRRAGRRHGSRQDGADAGASDDRKGSGAAGPAIADRVPDQCDPELDRRSASFRAATVSASAARRRPKGQLRGDPEARPRAVHLSVADP